VICADASTMPEVGGDAVLYFSPDRSDALVEQIHRLRDEPALRASLIERGAHRAAQYSWHRSAEGTLNAVAAGIAAAKQRASV
jgi:glycosyltransferase involved in cell wall biosynthesis